MTQFIKVEVCIDKNNPADSFWYDKEGESHPYTSKQDMLTHMGWWLDEEILGHKVLSKEEEYLPGIDQYIVGIEILA